MIKQCSRLDFLEEETVYVLVAEKASLIKRITVADGEWESMPSTPSKNYTYEAYHVPDLDTYKELIKSIANNPHKCIVNGRPSRSWKAGDTKPRNAKTLVNKKTKFMMLDIDDMPFDDWKHDTSASVAFRMIHERLTELNNGFDVANPGAVIHMTSSWGKPNTAGPRLRIIYALDRVVTTQQLFAFFKELRKRFKTAGVDPSLYKRAQIVYTANPKFDPPIADPIKPGHGRCMYNKKYETLDWDRLSNTYDATYQELIEQKAQPSTESQNKQFEAVTDKLAEEGLIRSVNHDKVNIICPWVNEHSSGEGHESSTTVWMKEDGTGGPVFYCQHQTCQDEHRMWPQAIKQWKHDGIISDQMLHDVAFEGAVDDFEKEPPPPAKNVWPAIKLPPLTNKATHEYNMIDAKSVFISDRANDVFIDRRTGESIRASVLSRILSRVENPFPDASRAGVYKKLDLTGVEAWEYTDLANNLKPGVSVNGEIWIPMQEKSDCIIDVGNNTYYNSFRRLHTTPRSGDADLFITHMHLLFPEDEGFNWAMGFFAHMMQRPWEKPTVALLHMSSIPGLGRGMLHKLMMNILGEQATCQSLKKITEEQNFNSFLYKKLYIGIEEVKVAAKNAEESGENMKTFITATDMEVNAKYKATGGTIPRFDRLFMMTNNDSAASISDSDRRLYAYSPPEGTEPREAAYYERFGAAINDPTFQAAVMNRLMTWRWAVFDPFKTPPMTAFKSEMAELSDDALTLYMRVAMDIHAPDLIGIPKHRMHDVLKIYANAQGIQLFPDTKIKLRGIMRRWQHKTFRRSYVDKRDQTLYFKNEHVKLAFDSYRSSALTKQREKKFEEKIEEMLLNIK